MMVKAGIDPYRIGSGLVVPAPGPQGSGGFVPFRKYPAG